MIQTIEASPDETYDIELEHSLLEANAQLARENRALLDGLGVTAIDVMGAIGSGKTTLIGCHLDANLVGKALRKVNLEKLRLIFIENIGNLICPAEFPLGSKARVVVVSV